MKRSILLVPIVVALSATSVAFAKTSCPSLVPATMHLQSDLSSTVSSASLGIYAIVENRSQTPISNDALAIDVMQANGDSMRVIDRFIAPSRVSVFASSTAKVGFIWKVPQDIAPGSYTIVATLAPENASRAEVFAHAEYPTATFVIQVKSDGAEPVSIKSLSVNDKAYTPNTVATVAKEGRVSVTAVNTNVSNAPYRGLLSWRLYAPDAKLLDPPISETRTPVELHPGSSQNMIYSLADASNSSYDLEGELGNDRGSVIFDILLDRASGAFPWTTCVANSNATRTQGPWSILGIAILILILAGGFVLYKKGFLLDGENQVG